MKNYFTKAIVCAGVMASALALSAVCAFAGDYSTIITSDYVTTTTSKSWNFTGISEKTTLAKNDTFKDIKVSAVGDGIQLHNNGYISAKKNSVILLPVPKDSAGSVKITNQSNQNSRYSLVEGNTAPVALSQSGTSQNFTSSDSSDNYISVTLSGGEAKLTNIEVELTSGNYAVATTYSITGSCSGLSADDTFTLKGTESGVSLTATVDSNGSTWTASTQSTDFSATDTYTVSKYPYSVKDTDDNTVSSVQLTAGGNNAYSVETSLVFSKLTLGYLEDGTYSYNGNTVFNLPNFQISTGVENAQKLANGQYITFKLESKKNVTISAKSGTTTNGLSAALYNCGEATVKDDSSEKLFSVYTAGDTRSTAEATVTLDAGTYNLVAVGPDPDDDTNNTGDASVQLVSITVADATSETVASKILAASDLDVTGVTVSYSDNACEDALVAKYAEDDKNGYLVVILSANQIKYDSLALGGDTITTAYEKVVFGENDELTATDAGGAAIVAYKLAKPTSAYTMMTGISAAFSVSE